MAAQKKSSKQKAGRQGGLVTYRKYGREYMRQLGRKGGRPHALTLEEIKQQAALSAQNAKKGGMATSGLPSSLKELKRLYAERFGQAERNRKSGRQ